MKVGFIGLGHMCAAAAANIRRGGFDLWVYDLEPSRACTLLREGAHWAQSPAELTDAVDMVITMVPGPKQIASVMRDSNGVLSRIHTGKLWIDMTTNSPVLFRELASEVG